ncbi:MAG: 30S ribosomal protein S17e [Candidatus Thermoplasmatota archaeon]|jgi:small subunit ribosomal protein S17e|nr:30S ribosomal protein S17e [Candidatus Thermoplasmatota archaeon]
MGAIRPTLVKTVARQLYEKYEVNLSKDFIHNKEIVNKALPDASKKLKNLVAGYVTTYWKNKKMPKKRKEPEAEEFSM